VDEPERLVTAMYHESLLLRPQGRRVVSK
jgi:hypothetical protein